MKSIKAGAIAAAIAMVLLPCVAIQVEWTGAGDQSNSYGDPKNFRTYSGGWINCLPQSGDLLVVKGDAPPLHVRNGDAALASVVTLYMESGSRVYWDVTTNSVYRRAISGPNEGKSSGEFIKMGGNSILRFAVTNDAFTCEAHYTVAEGTLNLPDYAASGLSTVRCGWCTVSNNAALVVDRNNAGNSRALNLLFQLVKCHGLLTNANPSVTHSIFTSYAEQIPSFVSGAMGGKLNLRVGAGEFNITSTNCTFSQMQARSSSVKYQTVVGIAKFGMAYSPDSSIGSISNLNSEVGSSAFEPVLYRYLGRGETTDKNFTFDLDDKYAERSVNHYFGIDGGPYGGAIFTGDWKGNSSRKLFSVFRITGTNSVPCQYSGMMSAIPSNGDIHYAPHFLKDGSGVWRFNERNLRSSTYVLGLTGAFSVEEGTLQFDSLGEQGENCALGTAGDLYDKVIGVYNESNKVDWAYSFGTTNETGAADLEGTLEFVGTNTAFASRRKISLLGNGRLKNSGTALLSIRGVSARAAGEHSITLDGANTMTNAIAEVSDGVAGARVSVVKEGAGKWWLKGNTTFSGDIVVKAGELNVEANTNRFDWFRFTFRKCGDVYNQPSELALYDEDGVRQNKGLKKPTNAPSGSPVRVRHQMCCDLKPGELYYGCSYSTVYQQGSAPIENATDDKNSAAIFQFLATPNEAVAFSWVPVVMRLNGTANEIASFDICSSWTNARWPTSYLVEGSQDGLNWQVLKDMPHGSFTMPTANYQWYSDRMDFVAGEVRKASEGHGYAIAGHPEVSSLPNVRSVRVDAGATLKTEYENVGTIPALKVSAAGGGTIDGFKFAASGAVDLVDVPEKGSLHIDLDIVNDGGTKANVAGWPVTINGRVESTRSARFTGSGFDILEYGLIMIIK